MNEFDRENRPPTVRIYRLEQRLDVLENKIATLEQENKDLKTKLDRVAGVQDDRIASEFDW